MRITPENWLTIEYVPETGTEYEIAPGVDGKSPVIRRLRARTWDVQRPFDELISKENVLQADPLQNDYPENVRMKAMLICTEGDELPEDYAGVNLDIVARVCADFFSLRHVRMRKQPT